jgi:hypothetical protein
MAERARCERPSRRSAALLAGALLALGCGGGRVLRGEVIERGAEPAGRELARWSTERCADARGASTSWPATARFVALADGRRALFETRVDGDSLRFVPSPDERVQRAALDTDDGVVVIEWRFDRAPELPEARAELRVAAGEGALRSASWAPPTLRLRCEGLRR